MVERIGQDRSQAVPHPGIRDQFRSWQPLATSPPQQVDPGEGVSLTGQEQHGQVEERPVLGAGFPVRRPRDDGAGN